MRLINPTDEELNAAFAKKVAGWTYDPQEGWRDENGFSDTVVDYLGFTTSADAVLPWLEKNLVFIKKEDGVWSVGVDGWTTIHYGTSDFFPKAAVIALLRAHGVEVEFTK